MISSVQNPARSTPTVLTTVKEFRIACDRVRAEGKTLALVPTLGALHSAHQALMRTGQVKADVLAVSIFVNPTQFGPGEDFERYPRDLQADVAICAEQGAELVFAPAPEEMYAADATTSVQVDALCRGLCGRHRPGHFQGVATIVTKLLIVAGPCMAIFGRKDFQQLRVIHRLVDDLLLPVEIVEQAIVREPDSLALSSRNRYLSVEERVHALAIPQALGAAVTAFNRGERNAEVLLGLAAAVLRAGGLTPEYVELVRIANLLPASGEIRSGEVGLFIAVRVGVTRLIDNAVLGIDDPLAGAVESTVGQS